MVRHTSQSLASLSKGTQMIIAIMNFDSYLFSQDSSLHTKLILYLFSVNMVYFKSKPFQINEHLRHTHTIEIADDI
jgi:hypothetical protein